VTLSEAPSPPIDSSTPKVRCNAEALARVRAVFQESFYAGREVGASLSIWQDGEERLTLSQGSLDRTGHQKWSDDTMVLVWSATKGPSSACVLHALNSEGISVEDPVASVWPEFGAAGKGGVSFASLLSHQAGLCALRDRTANALDHDAVARALAAQQPFWEPGSAHGYGPRAFGYLLEEISLRTVGCSIGEYWQKVFARPLGIDFFIGLPEGQEARVANSLAPAMSAVEGARTAFEREFARAGSVTNTAFSTPRGLAGVSVMNRPDVRASCLPAIGGIGSARGLAKFYSELLRQDALLSLQAITRRRVDGFDSVLQLPTSFSLGFMMNPTERGQVIRPTLGPGISSFGHPGAGGSLAFADPENRLSFAYVMNQMEPGAMPRERTQRLVRALYAG